MKRSGQSRRHFIKLAAATGLAAGSTGTALSSSLGPPQTREVPPGDRIGLGAVGTGGMGQNDIETALEVPGVQLIAAADIYSGRLERVKERFGQGVVTSRDHRDVLARSDVDAVLIATPDHWHEAIAIEALNAGKDVYVEKPMTQTVAAGLRVVEAERKTGRILQVGSQRVSSVIYEKARQLLATGAIGELNVVEAWWDRNSAIGAWQYTIPPDASPQTVDWDRFLGSAPRRPFEPIRLFRWRNYKDYGTGVAGDLFVHLFSGLHYIVGALGPTRVFSSGGLRHWKDGRDVPDVLLGIFDYPKTERHPEFNLFLRVNFADGSGGGSGFRFVGSEGVMTVGSGVSLLKKPRPQAPGYTVGSFASALQESIISEYREKHPHADSELLPAQEESYSVPRAYSDSLDHFTNFFHAVRSRKPVVEDAAFGLRAAGPALLSNRSQEEGRPIHWDPETMQAS